MLGDADSTSIYVVHVYSEVLLLRLRSHGPYFQSIFYFFLKAADPIRLKQETLEYSHVNAPL